MDRQDQDTREHLLNVAAQIFYEKGFHGARTQEIADRAGVNKAMLHYYFRNKEQLFDAVFEGALGVLMPSLVRFFTGDQPLREKISNVIDEYTTLLREHPHVPVFILSELRMHPDKIATMGEAISLRSEKLEAQIEAEIAAGNLRPIAPRHFVISLFSACIFPYISSPIWQKLLDLDQAEYEQLLTERKEALMDLFWDSLRP